MSTKELLLGRSMKHKICLLFAVLLVSAQVTFPYDLSGIPEYQGLVGNQKNLGKGVTTVCSWLKNPTSFITAVPNQNNYNVSAPFFAGRVINVIQQLPPVAATFQSEDGSQLTYSSIFSIFASIIGAPNYPLQISYLSLFTAAFDVYNQVPSAPSSAPFETSGAPINLYTALASAVTTYIQTRLATLTINNYGQTDGASLLATELSVIDSVMNSAAALFKNKLAKGDASLATNYQTILQNYAQRKAQLLLNWLDPLLTQLCTRYSLTLAQSGQVQTDLNIKNVDGYATLCVNALSAFSQSQSTTLLGQYSSSADAINAISVKSAQLYNYQALVYQNAVEHNISIIGQPGSLLASSDFTLLTGQIQTAYSYFNSAATNYCTAQQTNTGQAYVQLAAAVQSGLQNWQNAATNMSQGYVGQAAQFFEQASAQFKSAGFIGLSAYLYQQFQQALFLYDQTIFNTYGDYYNSLIAVYVAQAQQVPSSATAPSLADTHNTFQSFFYPLTEQQAQNATYKGMGWLAQVTVPSFKEMLNALQTLSVPTTSAGASTPAPTGSVAAAQTPAETLADQMQYLTVGIPLLQKIALGSQYIFYTAPGVLNSSKLAADENSSSYTVSGLVEALEQYSTIAALFGQADTLIATQGSGTTKGDYPLSQLLPQGSITTWKQFIMLHQAYWLLLCAQQAVAYVACSAVSSHVNELISFAAIAFLNAQAVYKRLGQTAMVSYIQTQLTNLVGPASSPAQYNGKTVQQLLQSCAQSYVSLPLGKTVTPLNVQVALACYQAGGLLGFASLRQSFFGLLDAYNTYAASNSSDIMQGLTPAVIAIQGMYAQNAGWTSTTSYTNNFSNAVATLTASLTAFANNITSLSPDQAVPQQQNFVKFYTQVQAFEEEQTRLASLYGGSTDAYLYVTQDSKVNVSLRSSLLKDPIATFIEPTYALAGFFNNSAQAQYQQLRIALTKNTFSGSLSQQISAIEALYDQAIAYYSAAGLQASVTAVEVEKSRAVELLYCFMVIPSETAATLTFENVFSPSTTNSPQRSTSKQSLLSSMPLYLLRSVDVDLTSLANSFITTTASAQSALQSSSLQVVGAPNKNLSPEIDTAQQLLTAAGPFVGKTFSSSGDITNLITTVLKPLKRIQLQQEGYNGPLSLDDAVNNYGVQLQTMMTTGMTIFGQVYKTSYTLVSQQQSDGTNHVIVQGFNIPLDPVPQYANQTQSALLYYSLANKFFSSNSGQSGTTTIGDATYMTFTDDILQKQVATYIQRAYLAGIVDYKSQIDSYIGSLQATKTVPLSQATFAQKAQLTFSDFQEQYATVNSMYTNLLALVEGAAQQQQQNASQSGAPLTTNSGSVEAQTFMDFAKVGSYFLMGDPSAGPFQSVLKDIANNYFSAAQTDQTNKTPYITMAKLYEQVADYTISLPLSIPQINGYPTTNPTGYPDSISLNTGASDFRNLPNLYKKQNIKTACSPLISSSNQLYHSTAQLSWNNYQKAVGFYQQAYRMYQQGYGLANNALLSNPDTVRTYGKFFYYDLFSALQAFSLFARNAYTASDAVTMVMNKEFETIVQQGGSAGVNQATQGFNQLMDGASASLNQYAQQQYNQMRSLVLNALIYLTGLQGALNQLTQQLGIANAFTAKGTAAANPVSMGYGTLLQCALTAYLPGLQAKVSEVQDRQTEDSLGAVFYVPPYMLDLQSSFDANNAHRIFYSDYFLTIMQYMVENSIGSPATNFAQLGNSANQYANLLIFTRLVSELWSMMRDAYGQAFLSQLYAAIQGNGNQQSALTAYENGIDNAIQTQEQTLLIDPASYIG